MQDIFPIFVSSGRAGLTLLEIMFDSHPLMAVAHEPRFLPPMARDHAKYERSGGFDVDRFVDDMYGYGNFRRLGLPEPEVRAALESAAVGGFSDAVRRVFAHYAESRGKQLYAVKSPLAVSFIEPLGRLFPEARFVHLVRDGRDVALAYLERDKGPATIGDAAFHWRLRVARGHRDGSRLGPDRYREFRYEELVDEPEMALREVCRFLDLEYAPQMLDYGETAARFLTDSKNPGDHQHVVMPPTRGLIDWRRDMDSSDVEAFESIAGGLLEDLGYPRSSDRRRSRFLVAGRWVGWWYRRITWRVFRRFRRG